MADDRWTGSPDFNHPRAALLCQQGLYGNGSPACSTTMLEDVTAGRGLGDDR